MEVCQKNGQSLGEADECGKSLTHFEVCQSVSEVPSPAVYGPSSAFGFPAGARIFFGRFPLVYEWKQASDLRRRNIGYCVNRVNAV